MVYKVVHVDRLGVLNCINVILEGVTHSNLVEAVNHVRYIVLVEYQTILFQESRWQL